MGVPGSGDARNSPSFQPFSAISLSLRSLREPTHSNFAQRAQRKGDRRGAGIRVGDAIPISLLIRTFHHIQSHAPKPPQSRQ